MSRAEAELMVANQAVRLAASGTAGAGRRGQGRSGAFAVLGGSARRRSTTQAEE